MSLPNTPEPAEQTKTFAAQVFQAVASAYLDFRRDYYHEAQPSLATTPPAHAEIRKAELALFVESILRATPQAIKSIPIVGTFLQHLEQVADMHSIAEEERTALHNLAIGFLHGVRGGIQPWYVEWLLASAQNLSQVTQTDYYLMFPFDGLLYHDPAALASFEAAVRTGDSAALQDDIEHLATQLIAALQNPVRAQPALAFTGRDSEHRRFVFNLKTVAGLALAAYLLTAEARHIIHPRHEAYPHSALAPLPARLAARVIDK
ncbi:MAG TPA: hypothetical protein VGF38_19760 [Ktedonobacterales bacterium]|jgi:hypothetical protein